MKKLIAAMAAPEALYAAPAASQPAAAPPVADADAPWPEAWFEIFRLAPGKHEEFIRFVAQGDEISAAGGQPPTQLFFHDNGADFDVILFKPAGAKLTREQEAAMKKKAAELGVPTGPAYFVYLRELVASHTDSHTIGPVSAAQWLARLDRWRAENPRRGARRP